MACNHMMDMYPNLTHKMVHDFLSSMRASSLGFGNSTYDKTGYQFPSVESSSRLAINAARSEKSIIKNVNPVSGLAVTGKSSIKSEHEGCWLFWLFQC